MTEHHQHHDHVEYDHGIGAWDDEAAEWYVKNYGDHPANRVTVQLAGLRSNDIVVDIGCGSGEAVREAATRVREGKVIGLDPTPAMIRSARELSTSHDGLDHIQFLQGSVENIPILGVFATVVMAINSMHHWEDPPKGFSEIFRILKPGGRFIVSDEIQQNGQYEHAESALDEPGKAAEAMEAAGFKEIRVTTQVDDRVRMIVIESTKPAA